MENLKLIGKYLWGMYLGFIVGWLGPSIDTKEWWIIVLPLVLLVELSVYIRKREKKCF